MKHIFKFLIFALTLTSCSTAHCNPSTSSEPQISSGNDSSSQAVVEILSLTDVEEYIDYQYTENDIKYLKISNTRISEISIVDRTKDLNIDLVNVKGEKRSPVSVFKDNTKSHININAVDSKYEFSSID